MAEWLGFTNHKLYQCRLLLQQAQHVQQPGALKQALTDCALYLLRDAYLSYLHELAAMAGYQQTFDSLSQLLQSVPMVTGEMRELEQLENDSFSWLRQFLNAVAAVGQKENVSVPVTPVQPGMITLLEEHQPDVQAWHSQLSQLIDLQRENLQEY